MKLLQYGHWNTARHRNRLPLHRNPGLELVLVENGGVTWDYVGRMIYTPPGHVSFSWPWQTHGARYECLDLVELYWLILPLRSGKRVVRSPRPHPDLTPLDVVEKTWGALRELAHPVLRLSPSGRKAFIATVDALSANDGVPDAAAWGWLLLLFAEIDQALKVEREGGVAPDLERVRWFMDSLPGRLGQAWTLDEMAAACGMGRSRFATAVKHVCGDTPMRLLARLRVEEAHRRLMETDERIGEIADALRFGSSHYFATVFKRYIGKTPSQARRGSRIPPSLGETGAFYTSR
ncbi:MAG: AraC family transcriptional regulator [Kiritimatiellia bacterium]